MSEKKSSDKKSNKKLILGVLLTVSVLAIAFSFYKASNNDSKPNSDVSSKLNENSPTKEKDGHEITENDAEDLSSEDRVVSEAVSNPFLEEVNGTTPEDSNMPIDKTKKEDTTTTSNLSEKDSGFKESPVQDQLPADEDIEEDSIFEGDDELISDIFKNATEIDLGYNLAEYNINLMSASDTHILLSANGSTLVLYDVYTKKMYQIDTMVSGGTISQDGRYVVYFKSDVVESKVFIYDIQNPKVSSIRKVDGEVKHVRMTQGNIYISYVDGYFGEDADTFNAKPRIINYPYVQGGYDIKNSIDSVYDVGTTMYIGKNKKLYFRSLKHGVTEFKANDTYKQFKNVTAPTFESGIIAEDGHVYSNVDGTLYVDDYPTEHTDVLQMAYVKGKLYFITSTFLYSYDGNKYEQYNAYLYPKNLVAGENSLYFSDMEQGLLYKIF